MAPGAPDVLAGKPRCGLVSWPDHNAAIAWDFANIRALELGHPIALGGSHFVVFPQFFPT
jgi:hypothetical protein